MKTNLNSRRKKLRTKLVHFTEQEERMIARAIVGSKKYMESYGKGRQPYYTDLSYYDNN